MRQRKIITALFLSIAVLLLVVDPVWAAPKAKYDETYDFSKIERVFITEPLFIQDSLEEKSKEELTKLFFEHVKLKRLQILTYKDVALSIQADKGIALDELEKTDPEQALQMLYKYLPNYADAIIYTTIRNFKDGSVYVEASTYTETKYEKYHAYDSKGNLKEYEYPVTRTYTIPAHYKSTFSVRVDFRLVEVKTQKDILWQSDYRYREYIKKKDSVNMYKRILRRFFSQVNKRLD